MKSSTDTDAEFTAGATLLFMHRIDYQICKFQSCNWQATRFQCLVVTPYSPRFPLEWH